MAGGGGGGGVWLGVGFYPSGRQPPIAHRIERSGAGLAVAAWGRGKVQPVCKWRGGEPQSFLRSAAIRWRWPGIPREV